MTSERRKQLLMSSRLGQAILVTIVPVHFCTDHFVGMAANDDFEAKHPRAAGGRFGDAKGAAAPASKESPMTKPGQAVAGIYARAARATARDIANAKEHLAKMKPDEIKRVAAATGLTVSKSASGKAVAAKIVAHIEDRRGSAIRTKLIGRPSAKAPRKAKAEKPTKSNTPPVTDVKSELLKTRDRYTTSGDVNPWKLDGSKANPHVLNSIQDAIKTAHSKLGRSLARPKIADIYTAVKAANPAVSVRDFQSGMVRLEKDGRVKLGAWTLALSAMPDDMAHTAFPLDAENKVYVEAQKLQPYGTSKSPVASVKKTDDMQSLGQRLNTATRSAMADPKQPASVLHGHVNEAIKSIKTKAGLAELYLHITDNVSNEGLKSRISGHSRAKLESLVHGVTTGRAGSYARADA